MSAGKNQKLKLLYLLKLLREETDEDHAMTMEEIIEGLADYDVNADRKTLYDDIRALEDFDLDILKERRGRQYYYACGEREFQLVEIKMLIDAVQSMKFLTENKTNELIERLVGMVSRYDAARLKKQIVPERRVKAWNERIYYNVDTIHKAIIDDRRIEFRYGQWDRNKQLVPRHDGVPYRVSPWRLIWDHDNYYLVAYDQKADIIKHFRVDKMSDVRVSKLEREGRDAYETTMTDDYRASHFGMYGGKPVQVAMVVENSLAGVMIDQFGRDVEMVPIDDEHFKVYADVAVSEVFIGWLIGVGKGIKIISPDEAVNAVKDTIRRLNEVYGI